MAEILPFLIGGSSLLGAYLLKPTSRRELADLPNHVQMLQIDEGGHRPAMYMRGGRTLDQTPTARGVLSRLMFWFGIFFCVGGVVHLFRG